MKKFRFAALLTTLALALVMPFAVAEETIDPGKYGLPGDPGPIALWSWRLRFTHPETGREMTFTHQPPPVAPWSGFHLPLAGR